jgi:hypothetical protein
VARAVACQDRMLIEPIVVIRTNGRHRPAGWSCEPKLAILRITFLVADYAGIARLGILLEEPYRHLECLLKNSVSVLNCCKGTGKNNFTSGAPFGSQKFTVVWMTTEGGVALASSRS